MTITERKNERQGLRTHHYEGLPPGTMEENTPSCCIRLGAGVNGERSESSSSSSPSSALLSILGATGSDPEGSVVVVVMSFGCMSPSVLEVSTKSRLSNLRPRSDSVGASVCSLAASGRAETGDPAGVDAPVRGPSGLSVSDAARECAARR